MYHSQTPFATECLQCDRDLKDAAADDDLERLKRLIAHAARMFHDSVVVGLSIEKIAQLESLLLLQASDRARCRDTTEGIWREGDVTCVSPLKVKADGFKYAATWDDVVFLKRPSPSSPCVSPLSAKLDEGDSACAGSLILPISAAAAKAQNVTLMPRGTTPRFTEGGAVKCVDHSEGIWREGVISCVTPLKVKASGFKYAAVWDMVLQADEHPPESLEQDVVQKLKQALFGNDLDRIRDAVDAANAKGHDSITLGKVEERLKRMMPNHP